MTIIPLLQTYHVEITVFFICGAVLGCFVGWLIEKSRLVPDLIARSSEVTSLSEKIEVYRVEIQ